DTRDWLDGARSPGMAMACLARELLKRSGGKAHFCASSTAPKSDDVYVMFGYDGEEVGLAAGDLALDVLDHVANGDKNARRSWKELQADYDDFLHLAERRALGRSTRSLINAAEERGVPW